MVAIYCDGADLEQMAEMAKNERVAGFTTNPSLMRKAGVTNYGEFADAVLKAVDGKPVSFEVFADDHEGMARQAREIASWGENVYVKIPVTNTAGVPSYDLIWRLSREGVKLNVTAIFTREQVRMAINALKGIDAIVSVFAGRIADTGVDPMRVMRSARANRHGDIKILWASAREVYNVRQAEEAECDIITLAPDLIAKLSGFGRNLAEYSLETVRQFHRDAQGYSL